LARILAPFLKFSALKSLTKEDSKFKTLLLNPASLYFQKKKSEQSNKMMISKNKGL
jgi:hypothetical protein